MPLLRLFDRERPNACRSTTGATTDTASTHPPQAAAEAQSSPAVIEDSLTSLVYKGQTIPADEKDAPQEKESLVKTCLRVEYDWLNPITGEFRVGRCKASFCDYCGPIEAQIKARVIAHGGRTGPPQRYAVLTQAPTDWSSCRQKVAKLSMTLRKIGIPWEIAWTVEANPAGTGNHLNVLQKGSYVPQEVLQDRWGAIVHVQAVKGAGGAQGVSQYVLKEALKVSGYVTKDAQTDVQAHRTLNGGRLAHLSRGYLGGMSTQEVRRLVLTRAEADEDEQWQRVPKRAV